MRMTKQLSLRRSLHLARSLKQWMEPLHTMLYMMLYHLVISVGAAVGSRVFGFHFWWHNVANGGIFASINGCEKKKAPASIGHMKRSLGTCF